MSKVMDFEPKFDVDYENYDENSTLPDMTFSSARNELDMLKSHLRSILRDPAMVQVPFNDGSGRMFTFEDFIKTTEGAFDATYYDSTLHYICKDMDAKGSYRNACASLTSLVMIFVQCIGKHVILGYPLISISNEESRENFRTFTTKLIQMIKTLIIVVGPEDLSDFMKWTVTVFHVYLVGISRRESMNMMNLTLHCLWNLNMTGCNYCSPVVQSNCTGCIPEVYRFITKMKRPGSKSYEPDDYRNHCIADVVLVFYKKFHNQDFQKKFAVKAKAIRKKEDLERRKAKLEREKARAKRKKEEDLERRKKEEERLEKVKEERKKKKQLYRKNNLAKAKLEEAQRQQGIESHLRLRLDRYYEKVRKEQEERKLFRHKLNAPHVMSPSRKREEKIRRREQQEDSHSIWRTQKRKHRKAQK